MKMMEMISSFEHIVPKGEEDIHCLDEYSEDYVCICNCKVDYENQLVIHCQINYE